LKIEGIIFEDSYIIITETLSSTMLMQNTCITDYVKLDIKTLLTLSEA
jgi:hypothetical protein